MHATGDSRPQSGTDALRDEISIVADKIVSQTGGPPTWYFHAKDSDQLIVDVLTKNANRHSRGRREVLFDFKLPVRRPLGVEGAAGQRGERPLWRQPNAVVARGEEFLSAG